MEPRDFFKLAVELAAPKIAAQPPVSRSASVSQLDTDVWHIKHAYEVVMKAWQATQTKG